MMNSLETNQRRYSDLLYLGIIALVGLCCSLVPLAQGELFFFWDNARLHFPQTVALHHGLRAGHIPEWSFSGGAGYPIVGEGNAGLFHPIRLLLTWLFAPHVAFMLEIGLYIALAGVMTYRFLQKFRVGDLACMLAGLTYMFGGFFMVSVKNIAHVRSLWVLPLVLLLAERFVASPRKIPWILLGGIAFGLQLLSGNPHYAAITAVASGVYIFFRAWQRSWNLNQSLRSAVWSIGSASVLWLFSAVIGVGIAAIQIVPQIMHVEQSTRLGGMSFDFAMILSAKLSYLGQLLLPFSYEQGVVRADPDVWGGFNPTSYSGLYMGMVPVALAAVAVWRHRRWPWPGWALVALSLTGTALAFGKGTPLYPALWSLPVFGSLRFPYRFLAITAVCIACLAGLGLAHIMDSRSETRLDNPASRGRGVSDAIPLAAVLGLAVAGAVYLWVSPHPWLPLAHDFERGTLISLALVAAACILVLGASLAGGHLRRILCVSLIVFTLGDLWWFRSRSDYTPTLKVDEVMTPPPVAKFLTRDNEHFRIMSLEVWEKSAPRVETILEFAQVHVNALWGLDSADPYESLMLRRYFIVHEALSWELLNSPTSAVRLQGYLGALNVKYIIAPSSVTLNGWKKVYESSRASVWQNPAVLPRAFLVGHVKPEHIEKRDEWVDRARNRQGRYPGMVRNWIPYAAESQIVDNILSSSMDYRKTAIVAGSGLPRVDAKGLEGTVIEGPRDSDVMRFSVETGRPSFLVISSNYYPGWTATVNGEPTIIYRTNWVMSGVFVPAGRTEVILRFSTPGLRTGLVVTLVTLSLVAFALAWVRRRSPHQHTNTEVDGNAVQSSGGEHRIRDV